MKTVSIVIPIWVTQPKVDKLVQDLKSLHTENHPIIPNIIKEGVMQRTLELNLSDKTSANELFNLGAYIGELFKE